MARVKRAIPQRDFSLGEIRKDFIEAKDLELRGAALRTAMNMRVLAPRVMSSRPGTFMKRTLGTADDVIEIRPATDLVFGLVLNDTSLQIIDSSARVVHTEAVVPWTDASGIWVEPFREKTYIGSGSFFYQLTYSDGTWTFEPTVFDDGLSGSLAQPYWAYEKNITVQPSATTGTVTLTASSSIWTADYVGLRVRYGQREILVTEYIGPTTIRGTVVSALPPSFDITVTSGSSFTVGDAVVGADTNFQGLIIAKAGNKLSVVTVDFFDGPDVGEDLSSPNGTSAVTVKTSISPLASPVYDEPLMSPVRGYARAATSASGRMILIDFIGAPSVICLGSSRSESDFTVGANDDDAIVREVGDNAPRFLHAVNAGDVLLFSDKGCYYIPIRDGSILTPSTFNAVLFDKRASNNVRPVQVADGVVFVEASGETISAALLDGNIYLKWSVRQLSIFHNHLIKTPKKLCGQSLYSTSAEKYLFVVNGDGTLAAVSWVEDFGNEKIGFVPWSTNGSYVNVAPVFGGYWAIVDRTIDGSTVRFLEQFDNDAMLDCAVTASTQSSTEFLSVNGDTLDVNGTSLIVQEPTAVHLGGETVSLWAQDWYAGDVTLASDGTIIDEPVISGDRQIGFDFDASMMPWAVEVLEVPRAGMVRARLIRVKISVMNTVSFQCRTNGTTRTVEAYSFGDDLSEPPPRKTGDYRFSVFGNRDHPEVEVIKHIPGPFTVTAITQEMQA